MAAPITEIQNPFETPNWQQHIDQLGQITVEGFNYANNLYLFWNKTARSIILNMKSPINQAYDMYYTIDRRLTINQLLNTTINNTMDHAFVVSDFEIPCAQRQPRFTNEILNVEINDMRKDYGCFSLGLLAL